MNAYFCMSQLVDIKEDYLDYGEGIGEWITYPGYIIEMMIAPDRGRAKYLFFKNHRNEIDEFTQIKSIRLLKSDIDQPEGIVNAHNSLYDLLWEIYTDKIL